MSLNDISEWQAIIALQPYILPTLPGIVDSTLRTPSAPELDEAAIAVANAKAGFEFELTRLFSRADLILFADARVDLARCRPKFQQLLTLLNSLAWTGGAALAARPGSRFQSIFSDQESAYDRFWYLLEYLGAVNLPFNLIHGPFGPAFSLPQDDDLAHGLEVLEVINLLIDSLPPLHGHDSTVATQHVKNDSDELHHDSLREYATTAFSAVFSRLQDCPTAHNAMLYLRTQQDDRRSAVDNEAIPCLDLFISSCPDHKKWREIECSHFDSGALNIQGRAVTSLCALIKEKKQQCIKLQVADKELHNGTKGVLRARHGNDAPSSSLQSLIQREVFKPLNVDHPVRFSKTEKRHLVRDIVKSFSALLGSEWVGKGWCSKDIFFLKKKLDETRSNTPFGPYVNCSSTGPPLGDLQRWEKLLDDDSPILLFLAKLLLEVDLGMDLDDRVEAALGDDEEESLLLDLLYDVYDEYKCDLDYGEAIDACLRYHLERQAKLEDGEIAEEPGQWTEWDRRYVRGVVKKLEDPAAEALHLEKPIVQQGWWVSTHPLSVSEGTASPSAPRSVQSGYAAPMSSAHMFNTSRASSTAPSSAAPEQPSLEPGKLFPAPQAPMCEPQCQRKDPPPPIVSQGPDLTVNISGWLDDADESVATQENPLFSKPDRGPDINEVELDADVLFDTTEYHELREYQEDNAKRAQQFWALMRDFNRKHFQLGGQPSPVKIALIDTGVDSQDPLVKPECASGRIRGCSWVGDDETNFQDTCGHGTHLARMVLKTNKTAEILVAKVSEGKTIGPKNRQNIVEAIEWAIEQDADIISLSLGFKTKDQAIEAALVEAIRPKKGGQGARPRLVFAAAANWGYNKGLAFPASMKGVICVHATSGNGVDGQINPSSGNEDRPLNFSVGTLGITIESAWQGKPVWLKGTSYSTPIAAAIAGNMLELARRQLGRGTSLESYRGMKAVMALMCTNNHSGSYPYFAPWLAYEQRIDQNTPERIQTTAQLWQAVEDRLDRLHYD